MNRSVTSVNVWPCCLLLALVVAVFSLSCRIGATQPLPEDRITDASVAGRFLGASRIAFGALFYANADKYFHKGIGHAEAQAFDDTPYQKLLAEISPEGHFHIAGRDLNEIMPWLWLSIKMNPDNPEVYLVAAFWLSHDVNHYDIALEVLRQAQCNIPFNYEIQMEKGRLLLRLNRLPEAAAAFDAGLAFWPGSLDPHSSDALIDRASLLLHRALLHEAEGDNAAAIAAMEEILTAFPERESLRYHITDLKAGTGSALLASQYWKKLMQAHDETLASQICGKDAHEQHEHPADDHAPE